MYPGNHCLEDLLVTPYRLGGVPYPTLHFLYMRGLDRKHEDMRTQIGITHGGEALEAFDKASRKPSERLKEDASAPRPETADGGVQLLSYWETRDKGYSQEELEEMTKRMMRQMKERAGQ